MNSRFGTAPACGVRKWCKIGILSAIFAAAPALAGDAVRQGENPGSATEVTIKGNVLCNRATESKDWFWDTKDGDHTPVIYALEGTPAIALARAKIMEAYPERGLNVEDALRVGEQFDKQLKYFLAQGPMTEKIHKDVEAGSQLLALTGRLSEKDGKKWIKITSYKPATVKYPAKMLAPDQPFEQAAAKPILLKINDTLSLKCIVLPAGRFLQGSPFYQRRYQDEFPHEVVLTRSFAMSEIPITQEIFEAVMGKNPSQSKGPSFPVDGVPFADITEFCRILSQKSGFTVRLPTDAEWEYAARVGTSNPCFTEKYKDQISETGSRHNRTPVKNKKPNAWGLFDMLSGGWHVTGDYKSDNVRVKEIDPRGPAPTDKRVHGDATGRLHKTRGGPHYDHIRPNIHGAATQKGTLWEGGSAIFRVVVEPRTTAAVSE
jgi:formylglycine-generating enzyme required for sulfatase activity